MMTRITINNNLFLQSLNLSHSPSLFGIVNANRQYLRQWLPWLDSSRTVEDTDNFIKGVLQKKEKQTGLVFGIWFDNKIVGTVGFNTIDLQKKQASIGYWLSSDYQGNCIATRSCCALIEHGVNELKLEVFTISCAEGNEKSKAIPIRLGFQFQKKEENKEWLYDHYVNHLVFSISSNEWKENSLNIKKNLKISEETDTNSFHSTKL